MLDDKELKQTIRAFFMDGEVPITTGIEIKHWDLDKNPRLEFNFDSNQTFEEFIKARKEIGLVENSTPEQLEKLIGTINIKRKPKVKTVYLKDFIDKIAEDLDDIIDAEILKELISVKVKNEDL